MRNRILDYSTQTHNLISARILWKIVHIFSESLSFIFSCWQYRLFAVWTFGHVCCIWIIPLLSRTPFSHWWCSQTCSPTFTGNGLKRLKREIDCERISTWPQGNIVSWSCLFWLGTWATSYISYFAFLSLQLISLLHSLLAMAIAMTL